jgi:uncharacterized DUF497 family protein
VLFYSARQLSLSLERSRTGLLSEKHAYFNVLTKGTQIAKFHTVTYDWNEEKNRQLKKQRSISFEEIVLCIQEDRIVTVLEHPNKEKYPNQLLYLINYRKQIYVVPFVINKEEQVIFLKTIYPSRHYTKKYLEQKNETN